MALFHPIGVVAQVDRKKEFKSMKRLMQLLEEKALSMFPEPTYAHAEKFEMVCSIRRQLLPTSEKQTSLER